MAMQLLTLCAAVAPFLSASTILAAEATMSYLDAEPLVEETLEGHATTRLFDWDDDGVSDLVTGGGDGRIWLFRKTSAGFEKRVPITAGDRDRWGSGYTGVVLADLIGKDGLPELVVAHSHDRISIHENLGHPRRPDFSGAEILVTVQKGCQGRFDVADWDGDGLLDLVTGSFSGRLVWYRNEGTASASRFGEGRPFHGISRAYNSHPRILDFNRDGLLDLALGVNWGSVEIFLNRGRPGHPELMPGTPLEWATNGKGLNIRELNGDDSTPDFGDLDGDGVLDLISGGKNGRLFLMRGVGRASKLTDLAIALSEHSSGTDLAFGLLKSLRADLGSGLIDEKSRAEMFDGLVELAEEYPDILRRRQFDLETIPHAPMLAGQFWVVLLDSGDASREHREKVADAAGFGDGHRSLLVDLGVVFIDNDTATPQHLAAMHELLTAMPRSVWDVQTITAAGWLGEGAKTHKISSRSGVNIFAMPMGRRENSFATDAPRPGVTDVYLICLAHEVAHNMLDTVGRDLRPELYEYKFEGLAQSAGPDVVYHHPKSRGVDRDATKERFRRAGAWDGNEKTWPAAWKGYFRNLKAATRFDRAHVRGNIQFFLDAPQEAFATLANQYFANSRLMLEFCKVRWDDGHRSNINQFLLIADYLSENGDAVPFYILEPEEELQVASARLKRDGRNRITDLWFEELHAVFTYGEGRLVTGLEIR